MRVGNGGAFGLPRLFLVAFLAIPVATSRTPFSEIRHLFTSLATEQLPADLRDLGDAERAARWPSWLDRHDRAIRERLQRGDEDTVVLWMALGASFTREPRVSDVLAASPDDGGARTGSRRA